MGAYSSAAGFTGNRCGVAVDKSVQLPLLSSKSIIILIGRSGFSKAVLPISIHHIACAPTVRLFCLAALLTDSYSFTPMEIIFLSVECLICIPFPIEELVRVSLNESTYFYKCNHMYAVACCYTLKIWVLSTKSQLPLLFEKNPIRMGYLF